MAHLMRACRCTDDSAEPRLVYLTREGDRVRRRLRHDECGTAWWQIECLDGQEIATHVDG